MLRETAKDAPNRAGKVFRIFEFKRLLTTCWIVSMASEISLVEWIILAFCAKSFLLGALRAEQFERFRLGGVTGITFYRENMDDEGNRHPIRTHRADSRIQLQPSEEQERLQPDEGRRGLRVGNTVGYRHISRDIWRGNSRNFRNFQKPDITGYKFTWGFHLNQQFRCKIFQKSRRPDICRTGYMPIPHCRLG